MCVAIHVCVSLFSAKGCVVEGRTAQSAAKVSPAVKPFQILLRNICAHKYGASAIFDAVSPKAKLSLHTPVPQGSLRLTAPSAPSRLTPSARLLRDTFAIDVADIKA